MRNRALFDLRAFDWLDESLPPARDSPWLQDGELLLGMAHCLKTRQLGIRTHLS